MPRYLKTRTEVTIAITVAAWLNSRMSDGRLGIDAKFERARTHAANLRTQMEQFQFSDYAQVIEEIEPNGDQVSRVKIVAPLPTSLALTAGDAIHNARAALDHLACRLVETAGGTVTQDTAFPFKKDETGFGPFAKSRLPGTSAETRAAMRSLKPWAGGDDLLYALHTLDIVDKHKLLLTIAVFSFGTRFDVRTATGEALTFAVSVPGLPYVAEDGQEIDRVPASDRTPEGFPVQTHTSPLLAIGFGVDTPLASRLVNDALEDLIEHAALCVEPLVKTVA